MVTRNHTAVKRSAFPICTLLILTLMVFIPVQSGYGQASPNPYGAGYDRPLNTLRDLNQAFIDIVAEVKPSVVTVSTERVMSVRPTNPFSDDFFDFFFGPRRQQPQDEPREREYEQRARGLGSGIIVDVDGYVLTNNHVVAKADTIFVQTHDGRRYTATVVSTDPKTDIAVLQIDADNLKPIAIGDSDELQVGEIVLAVGSPLSENLAYTVTQGIVSAKGRSNVGLADYEDFIQTDAAINPGNSGGPLVNLDGELVGINTAIATRTGGYQGVGFAVPSNMAVYIMNSLIEHGKVSRGWLGVLIQDITPELAEAFDLDRTDGVLIGDVVEDSPAEKAGFEQGDVIISLEGEEMVSASQLRNTVASTPPGTRVRFTVLRDGSEQILTVKLGELEGEETLADAEGNLEEKLGFSVGSFTRELADRYNHDRDEQGVIVTSLSPASAAARAGLREGDLIQSVNRQTVQDIQDFRSIIDPLNEGDRVLLLISRAGNNLFLTFTL